MLLVDEASVLKSTKNKSFFRNSRTTKTIEQQDFFEKRLERLLDFPMRVEEKRFDLFWRVGHELEENSVVTERSVWKSAKRGSSGLKQAIVVPYFEEKQPEPLTTSLNLLHNRSMLCPQSSTEAERRLLISMDEVKASSLTQITPRT